MKDMTITITLTAEIGSSTGVDFNADFESYFSDLVPSGWPYILGGESTFEGDQMILLDKVNGADTKSIILDGEDFNYYFNDHTLSGTLTTVRLSTLGDSYNSSDGSFTTEDGHIVNVSTPIEISGLDISNAYGTKGDLHNVIYGLMGGSNDGGASNPSLLEEFLWAEGHNVVGSTGADKYSGTAFADTIRGNGGNDVLDGKAGTDIAVFSGTKANYTLTKNADGSITVKDSRAGKDGTDTLKNIETAKFSDGTINLTTLSGNKAPVISSNSGGATAAVAINENATAVTTVKATDPEGNTIAYSISGGADAALFKIDAKTGALSFKAAPNFEAPKDAGKNNVYDVTVKASDGSLSDTQAIKVTVRDVAETPVISSNGGASTASVSINENTATVTTVKATDPQKQALTYSISGGADAALFKIDAKTGALAFKAAPNFEVPKDSGANNVYDVTVKASDGTHADSQAIKVTVKNVNEAPNTVTLSKATVAENTKVGTTIGTFGATDPEKGALTYALTDTAGGLFKLSGNKLQVAKAIDYEKVQSDTVTVQVKDSAGLSVSKTFTIKVTDVVEAVKAPSAGGTTKGGIGADVLEGGSGKDTLQGLGGNDTLKGAAGADTLYGGAGADDLYGGAGADTFQFKALSETTVAASGRDTIFDFSAAAGDRIDLSGIDANTKTTANDAFSFVGTKAFSGKAGELRYEKQASDTYVYGDVNGDKKADFAIHLDDAITFEKGYFVL
jgi:Ca2+-binding RTX toxin-like protein